MTDLLTRGNEKGRFKNKITEADLASFLQINFDGLPNMALSDAMHLVHKALQLIDKGRQNKNCDLNIKQVFPNVPLIINYMGPDRASLCFGAGSYVGQVAQSTDFHISNRPQSALSVVSNKTASIINWSATDDT